MKLNEIYDEYNKNFSRGILPYTKCMNCGKVYYYPRDSCPACGKGDLKIMQSAGQGTVYSYTKFNNGFYGIISFSEGFRAYMDISGNNPEIGIEVDIKFKKIRDNLLPYAELK